jgi:hypothetical protein
MSLSDIIAIHVNGSGPVTFSSILTYVHVQFGPVEDYEVAKALTDLIRAGTVQLYDDGESFSPDKP